MRIIHFSDFHLQGGKILILHKINAEKLLDALRKVNKQKNRLGRIWWRLDRPWRRII